MNRTLSGVDRRRQLVALVLRKGFSQISFCRGPPDAEIFVTAIRDNLILCNATYVACTGALGLLLYTRDKETLHHCQDVAWSIAGA